jgi:predicted ArsR family transcriptional regulator
MLEFLENLKNREETMVRTTVRTTVVQDEYLRVLDGLGEASIAEVSRAMGVTTQAAGEMLVTLRRNGLVLVRLRRDGRGGRPMHLYRSAE